MSFDETGTVRYAGGNMLLDQLPMAERPEVLADVRVARVESSDLISRDGSVISEVIFPVDALMSLTARLHDGSAYEVGTVGRQGAVGIEASFGVATLSRATICQIDGSYAAIPRAAFLRHVEHRPSFRLAVQRAYAAQLFAAEQTLTCNVAHSIGERTARWLLTVAHQIGTTTFRLREEFLAMMLGQPDARSLLGVQTLVEFGAIGYENEMVSIRDAAILQDATCECYGILRAYWAALTEHHNGSAAAYE